MSHAPHSPDPNESHESHEGPIKTSKQLIAAVVAAFLVPIFGIILFVNYVTTTNQPAAGTLALEQQATAERIQPVGVVALNLGDSASAPRTGEAVFKAQCSACHANGMLGAPKLGDTAAWGPRIGQGFELLWQHALKGKNSMPAQGGGDASDVEVARAVVYMANAGGAKFPEPVVAVSAPASAVAQPASAAQQATLTAAVPVLAAAEVNATPPAAKTGASEQAPELFKQTCAMCHATGVAGAPKVGDKAAWAPRLVQGIDGLTSSAIKGKNSMPPRGTAMGATDAQIKEVVTYMVNAVK